MKITQLLSLLALVTLGIASTLPTANSTPGDNPAAVAIQVTPGADGSDLDISAPDSTEDPDVSFDFLDGLESPGPDTFDDPDVSPPDTFTDVSPPDTTDALLRVGYKCETTAASPTLTELRRLKQKLMARTPGEQCKHRNPYGSHCTRIASWGGASASICGRDGNYMTCWTAAYWVNFVMGKCTGRGVGAGKAGGWVQVGVVKLMVH